MEDLEYEFMLQDRIAKIQAINEQYDLEHNGYISFSGGKDSVILSYLIDMALPNNKIPRVFANTGIEYKLMVEYVKEQASKDNRIIILKQIHNIRKTLDTYGYPFKSKSFAHNYSIFQNIGDKSKTYQAMKKSAKFGIPPVLKYMFNAKDTIKFKVSEQCCYKLKKDLVNRWKDESGKSVNLTGIRAEEGGNRATINCTIFNEDKLVKFHPLLVVTEEWEEEFVKRFRVKLCKLYYPPYNFGRTGCKGCPFALRLQDELLTMKKLLPNEYKQCLHLWKPVYDEYVRLGYRLSKDFYDIQPQYNIFDFMKE